MTRIFYFFPRKHFHAVHRASGMRNQKINVIKLTPVIRKLFFISVAILIVEVLHSQQREILRADGKVLTNTAIDSIANKLMDKAGVTGLCIGIINNNKFDYVKSYGYKNRAAKQLNDTATCFYAASLSKPLFAYLVMQLVDKGIIDLDKPLYKYLPKPLPDYENYKDLSGDERWKLITARHCLSHTTGFPNWRQLNPKGNQKLEIFFLPGERYAYSGEGLYLLQFVVETITKQNLERLAQEKIFKPFNMTRTSFIWQDSFEANFAVGHDKDEVGFPKSKRKEANAAGSMETTIADYTRFLASVMQGKEISSKSRQEMLSPQIGIFTKHQFPSLNNDTTSENKNFQLSYGLGWGLFKSNYGSAFFKEGHSDDGWEHYIISFPEKKSALILMTNSLNGESIFKEILEKLSGITIPWAWEGYASYRPTVKLSEGILAQYTGDYNGRIKAAVSLVNGQLQIESQTEGLPKTNLYPESENSFFMKSMQVNLKFIKNANGKVGKVAVDDEGVQYELNRINDTTSTKSILIENVSPSIEKFSEAEITLSKDVLSAYVGKYYLTDQPKRMIIIKMKDNHLIANVSGQETVELVFQTETKFKFKKVIDAQCEFVKENGRITKLIVDQNGKYEWKKAN